MHVYSFSFSLVKNIILNSTDNVIFKTKFIGNLIRVIFSMAVQFRKVLEFQHNSQVLRKASIFKRNPSNF